MKRFFIPLLSLALLLITETLLAQEDFTQMALDQKSKTRRNYRALYGDCSRAREYGEKIKCKHLSLKKYQQFAMSQKNPLEEIAKDHQSVSDAIIFVSFSMPKQSLEQWLAVSRQLHIPLVLRGMIDNSIKKDRTKRLFHLLKKVHGAFKLILFYFARLIFNKCLPLLSLIIMVVARMPSAAIKNSSMSFMVKRQ
ncbi:MAG: hypothetical protein LRY43_00970 [Gammaproteobacteria bacterium]|nr:hypothetical protein [Gammaproteobacteria bacterium]